MKDANARSLLARTDLNLLVVLDALLQKRSVTRAAESLGVTQSAVSHALRRLREALRDPLLVRSGASMACTPRAERLQRPLRALLRGLADTLLSPDGFAPATTRRAFRMVSPDLFDVMVLPELLDRMRSRAATSTSPSRPRCSSGATPRARRGVTS